MSNEQDEQQFLDDLGNGRPTLEVAVYNAFEGISQERAQILARAIRATIRQEIAMTPDEFVASMGEPQPEPPAPPAFAVGTRVRVLVDDAPVKVGQEGVIEVEDDPNLHDGKIVYGVKVEGVGGLCDFEPHELEPLPSEPAQDAPALPAGVTVNDEFTIYDDNDVGTAITFTITETMLEIVPDSADAETSIDIERAIKLHTFLGRAIETMKANAIAYKREQQAREMNEFKGKLGGTDGDA